MNCLYIDVVLGFVIIALIARSMFLKHLLSLKEIKEIELLIVRQKEETKRLEIVKNVSGELNEE